MSREVRYVCHRAANAIITEVDPLRVSTDALQVINQFLDEFVQLLLSSSQSFDLSRIKTTVLSLLLSSAVGKNAIVEAELQVKSYSESTDTIDYEAYERTRTLDPSTLSKLVDRLREDIVNYCTLAEKNHQSPRRPSLASTISTKTNNTVNNIAISPIVIVYVTAIIEHVAEYILTAIAMTAEHQDTEYIRVKEVYLTLMDDTQVGNMFSKMALRERLEKRASVLNYRSSQQSQPPPQQNILPSPAPSPVTSSRKQSNVHIRESTVDPYMDIGFVDDEEMDYSQPGSPPPNGKIPSMYSMTHARPMSIMSTSTSTNTISSTTSSGSKKGFRLFGKKRDSVATDASSPQSPVRQHHNHHHSYQPSQQQQNQRASKTPIAVSVYHSDTPAINFEDLIKSGDTVRLSLTPSRLKSIEVMKDHSAIDESTSMRSTDSDSFIATKQQPPLPPPHQRQIRPTSMERSVPAIHHNHNNNNNNNNNNNTPITTRRAVSSDLPASQFQQQQLQQRHSHQVLHKKLSLDEPVTPFENPRSAPKPPILRSIAPGTRTSFIEPDHPPRRTPRRQQQTKEELERPSSMVAKRASMISSARPTSYHENFALQYADGEEPPQQLSLLSTSTTTATMISTKSNGGVREKVLKFELAKSEQSMATQTPKPISLEVGVQTDPELPRVVVTGEDASSERGIVVGDEEWFVPDEDWEEDEHEQEHTIVEWLLGE